LNQSENRKEKYNRKQAVMWFIQQGDLHSYSFILMPVLDLNFTVKCFKDGDFLYQSVDKVFI